MKLGVHIWRMRRSYGRRCGADAGNGIKMMDVWVSRRQKRIFNIGGGGDGGFVVRVFDSWCGVGNKAIL